MAPLSNTKELTTYGLKPPTTWAQFADDASVIHKADARVYIANLPAEKAASPFNYSGGGSVTIDFTGPAQKAFALLARVDLKTRGQHYPRPHPKDIVTSTTAPT